MAIWHKGAKLLIIERTIRNLFHMFLAQVECHESYEKEMERLEERRELLVNGNVVKSPKTPEECKQARLEFARAMGFKNVNQKPEVKHGI